MIKHIAFIAVVGVVMYAVLILSFTQVESPFTVRGNKIDEKRVSDLTNLKYYIDNYYATNYQLPKDLDDLPFSTIDENIYKDPETEESYEYNKKNDYQYSLCARFATQSKKTTKKKDDYYGVQNTTPDFNHGKGRECFDLEVYNAYGPTTYPLYESAETPEMNRDNTRISNMSSLQTSINITLQESTKSAVLVLCAGDPDGKYPCSGSSLENTSTTAQNVDGTGWAKVAISKAETYYLPQLPLDPYNDQLNHYVYCASDDRWEVNTILESPNNTSLMQQDGGDDDKKYELGSDLTLIGNTPGCEY